MITTHAVGLVSVYGCVGVTVRVCLSTLEHLWYDHHFFLQIRSKGQKFENDCIPMRDGGDLTSLTFFQLSNKFLSLFCKILEFRGSWAGAIFLDKVVIFFSVQYTFAPCLVLGPA